MTTTGRIIGGVCGLLGFALFALFLVMLRNVESPEPLKASVRFTGTQFVVTNDAPVGSLDWTDVSVEVNRPDSYAVRIPMIAGGASEAIGALRFAKADGTRFNPMQTKPQNVWVRANVGGLSKFVVAHFE